MKNETQVYPLPYFQSPTTMIMRIKETIKSIGKERKADQG